MAGTYRYLAYDLRTNEALEELPLADVDYGAALNASGNLTATLRPSAATAALYAAATTPERTIVYVERDGVLVGDGGYIVWKRVRRPGTGFSLVCAGVASLLRRGRLVATLAYTATDQFTIARALVAAMQAQPGGDIGIDEGTGTCGVTRDRTYWGYERKNIGDALAELGAVNDGFDWAIDVAYASGVPTKTLTLSYPRRGRIAGTTGIVFESGKNLVDYTFTEDGTRSARSVDVLGAGDGGDMVIGTQTRTDLIDAGYPLTSEVLSAKDVVEQTTVDAKAIAAVAARAATPTFLELTIDPNDVDAGLGSWIVGDDALVRITDEHFPLSADGTPGYLAHHRIISYSVKVPDDGPETVTIVCGQVAA